MKPLRAGTSPPWVIAHRGASLSHPENTAAAFDEALAQGCDGFELDVQLSRDGVPVVYHDRTLRKAGGGGKRVAQLDAREIAKLDVGGWVDRRFRGERIPTLKEVLWGYGPRTRLLVELKVRDRDRAEGIHLHLARSVAETIRSMRLERRVLVLSFDSEALEVVSAMVPRLGVVLNVKAPRRMTASLRQRLNSLFALSVDVRTLSPSIVRATHGVGRPVMVFTCNTPRTVKRALDSEVDAIMSDRPGWLRSFLRRDEAAR